MSMVPPALFVWLVLLVSAAKMPLEEAGLVAGTLQNLSNLDFLLQSVTKTNVSLLTMPCLYWQSLVR